jgi:hypothetical protein
MTLNFAGVFAEVAALWRRDRDLLLRIASVFFFLPGLAMLFFLPDMPAATPGSDEGARIFLQHLLANAHWFALQQVVELFGAGLLFVLYLRPGARSVGEGLGETLRAFPGFVLSMVLSFAMVFCGAMLFFVPGFYLAGRTFLFGPIAIAERRGSPFQVAVRGFALTQKQGWNLFALVVITALPSYGIAILAGTLQRGLGDGPVGVAIASPIAAAASGATLLAVTLLRVAVYKRLTAASFGM